MPFYIDDINKTNKTATIYLYGVVGDKIDGELIASEIRYLTNSGIETISLHINSGGGNIISGLSIIAAMIESDAVIHTYNDGVCASMAGIILSCGEKRFSVSYGRMMLHEPSLWGETIDSAKDDKIKRALIAFKTQLIQILEENTKKDSDKLEEILHNETWYTSKEAKRNGFIDEILPKNKISNEIKTDMTANQLMEAVCNYHFKNQEINKPNKPNKMELINNHLGLNPDANETAVLSKIKEIEVIAAKAESFNKDISDKDELIETQKTEIKTLETAKTELETKVEDANKKTAGAIVDQSISDGKFKIEDREDLLKQAEKDIDGFNLLISKMEMSHVDIASKIEGGVDNGKYQGKTLRELEKDSPELVKNIMDNNPTMYKLLYKAQYGVDPAV